MSENSLDPAALDFESVTPEEFAKLIKELSAKEMAEIMKGDLRLQILDAVFERMAKQFRPDRAAGVNALIRWVVQGETEVVYEVSVADGGCEVSKGATDKDASAMLTIDDADFLELVSGNASPVTQFFSRKLEIGGDIAFAAGLPRMFDIPKAS